MDLEKEKELLKKAQQGDSRAYTQLVSHFQERLYRRALALLGNPDAAQDALQATLIAAYRFLKSFRGASSIYTWLYRILSNKCHDHFQKQKKSVPLDVGACEPILRDERVNLQKNLELSEDARYLMEKVNALPKKYRKVILYRYYDNLSYAEIAELICVKEGTVKSRLFQARNLLHRVIVREGREQELMQN